MQKIRQVDSCVKNYDCTELISDRPTEVLLEAFQAMVTMTQF
jgi:hypothetical protein